MAFEYAKETQLSFPILVMEQIRIIQRIVSKELRDSTRIIKTPIGDQLFENEDTRYSFLQSVELLGSMLGPWFIGENQKAFDDFIEDYNMELVQAWEDKDFKKDAQKVLGIKNDKIEEISKDMKTQLLTYFLNEKCKEARDIFRMLVKCFKDNDFLKSASYSEGTDEGSDAFDEEEGVAEE